MVGASQNRAPSTTFMQRRHVADKERLGDGAPLQAQNMRLCFNLRSLSEPPPRGGGSLSDRKLKQSLIFWAWRGAPSPSRSLSATCLLCINVVDGARFWLAPTMYLACFDH